MLLPPLLLLLVKEQAIGGTIAVAAAETVRMVRTDPRRENAPS
jgi:hypothetical protein